MVDPDNTSTGGTGAVDARQFLADFETVTNRALNKSPVPIKHQGVEYHATGMRDGKLQLRPITGSGAQTEVICDAGYLAELYAAWGIPGVLQAEAAGGTTDNR